MDNEYRPEKYLLAYTIDDTLQDLELPRQGLVLRMLVTNLRNRPLTEEDPPSLTSCILGLYLNLMTGSKDFPFIILQGALEVWLLDTPFELDIDMENATPSPLTRAPAGLMVPPADPSSPLRAIRMPRHPEKASYMELKADRRNSVRVLRCRDHVVIRVISPVFQTDNTERPNRWRISDYDEEGNILMSVLCLFKLNPEERAVQSAKRKRSEDESSSPSPPKKCLRV